ncbi:MAG TPA: MGMT family protein [Anaerolineae bacterium]|nr:MGMT family protein [Anaerolineae bacterium]HIQ04736.1 MGMT family protein [Anaerolineae bacterium]
MRNRFFARVWALVCLIPPGYVATYGQIAALLGNRRAARTVGWALASLPPGTDVPWQRVINASGRISIRNLNFAAEEQRALLEAEGIEFDEYGYVNLDRFGWPGPDPAALEAIWGGFAQEEEPSAVGSRPSASG